MVLKPVLTLWTKTSLPKMPELMLPQTAPEPLKESDSNNIQMGDKRKPKNMGKNLMCRLQSIFPSSSSNAEASKPSKLTTEEALLWSQSLEKLLESKYGMTTFRAFLRSEFSDENIEFWLTCEDFKKVKSSRLSSKAKKIYEHYIRAEAPKEINIDHHTRETIKANVQNPTIHCFDDAQKIVYGLMERDSYPRFLRSDIYQTLSGKLQPGSVNG
ncbi:regulator of G-protein signaling 21-like [Acipenser oxyrinchus oxyrinchus]|uniref:Regulator of G-protein signaling 21-like n=1 Tax=Acipenser oxyrinchus oxyrinchus TaxID=40147 RepID=A0AAD8D9P3_ACIOX|nr:regulator of G-protein signaling 21-like [Acipenser oxyrinchus oxyrinchus]